MSHYKNGFTPSDGLSMSFDFRDAPTVKFEAEPNPSDDATHTLVQFEHDGQGWVAKWSEPAILIGYEVGPSERCGCDCGHTEP